MLINPLKIKQSWCTPTPIKESKLKQSVRLDVDGKTQVTRSKWSRVFLFDPNMFCVFIQTTPLKLAVVSVAVDKLVTAIAAFSSKYKVRIDKVNAAFFDLNSSDTTIWIQNCLEIVGVDGKRRWLPVDDVNSSKYVIARKFGVDGIIRMIEVSAVQLEDIGVVTVGKGMVSSIATGMRFRGLVSVNIL